MEVLPNIDPFRERYNEVELQLSEPDVFKDAFRASSLNRELTRDIGHDVSSDALGTQMTEQAFYSVCSSSAVLEASGNNAMTSSAGWE